MKTFFLLKCARMLARIKAIVGIIEYVKIIIKAFKKSVLKLVTVLIIGVSKYNAIKKAKTAIKP